MCSLSALKCPLCAQTNFPNIDALRVSLIKAANGPLACPICHELFLGLDKLTIHLFSHTSVMMTEATEAAAAAAAVTTDTARPTVVETVKKTAVKSEVKLETDETVITQAETAKRSNKEKKTKKPRQIVEAMPKTVEKLNESAAFRAQSLADGRNCEIEKAPEATFATCDICEFTFRDEELRDMHFRLVHQNVCHTNGDLTTNAATTSSEPDFKCHLCSKTFKMKGSLRVHLKVVHLMCLPYTGNSPKLSICDRIRHKEIKAGAIAGSKATLGIAQLTPVKAERSGAQILQPPTTVAPPLEQHQITLATNVSPATAQVPSGFTFGTLTLLPAPTVASNASGSLLNLNSNGEFVHAVDGAPLNSNVLLVINANPPAALVGTEAVTAVASGTAGELPSKSLGESAKMWKCNECAKTFTTKYFLKKHKRLHTGEMPYTCEICARTFTFQQSYHKHLLYHSNEKPHVCSTCGRAFKELSTLHNHERIHSGEKPFKCEVCGKCFRQRVSFLVHTRIHTGIMPYKCDVCQKSFRYKVSQRTHKCQPQQNFPDEFESETGNGLDKQAPDHPTDDISESFIKEFLENTRVHTGDAQNSPASAEIAAINAASDCNGNVDEALLSKAIDDIVVESCNKMGIGNRNVRSQHLSSSNSSNVVAPTLACSDDCNSPTQKLQNMRLYSPQLVAAMGDGGSDSVDNIFPRFLLDDVGNNSML